MKIIYIDSSSGISGDMTLAAMLDCGLPFEHLKSELDKLNLHGYDLKYYEDSSGDFRGARFEVKLEDHHDHGKNKHEHHHRGLKDILEIIEKSILKDEVKSLSLTMFRMLAEVEGKVHGIEPEKVHFHEVGAIDSIIDIVGVCVGFDYFKPDIVVSSPANLGSGYIETQHGKLPVPPPAVAELSKGLSVFSDDSGTELTTPTGALILKTFVTRFGSMPLMTIEDSGSGKGSRSVPGLVNILRMFIGELTEGEVIPGEKITVLETEIDDMPPENFGYLMEKLAMLKVLDTYFTPVQMKKNRPGVLLTCLVKPAKKTEAIETILMETSTLGIRAYETERYCIHRRFTEVETRYGIIKMKQGVIGEKVITSSPEYEDCRKAAEKHEVPLKDVQNEAIYQFRKKENE